jgi:hypothetical protein
MGSPKLVPVRVPTGPARRFGVARQRSRAPARSLAHRPAAVSRLLVSRFVMRAHGLQASLVEA